MNWPWSRRSDLLQMFQIMVEQNQKTQQTVMAAVQSMAGASEKQAEVLNSYLKLFTTPGDPERWTADPVADNQAELAQLGFPKDADEKTQSEWVLDHLEQL